MRGSRTCLSLLPLLIAVPCAAAAPEDRWVQNYFYDVDNASLHIVDVQFPSARRGIAIGFIEDKKKTRGVALVSNDGGARWSETPLKEIPFALSFIDDTRGWMITENGIWKSEESGRTWTKLKSMRGLLDIHFENATHGWVAGARKSVFETNDGGATWNRLEVAEGVSANADYTSYHTMAFNGPIGFIAGSSRPPRRDSGRLPEWMEPERAERRREWPGLSIVLETKDHGKTWTPSTTSIFGRITRILLPNLQRGFALIEFEHSFEVPAEVIALDLRTGKSSSAFRQKDRIITDVAVDRDGTAYLACVEPPGKLANVPIPGKVKILKSTDWSNWTEMPVDYRAVARRVSLAAAPDSGDLWASTDTGIILKLEKSATAPR